MEEKNVSKTQKKKKVKTITVKANKKGRHIMPILNLLRIIIIPIFWLVKPFRFYGNRKVKDGACVYVCNHYCLMDPVYSAATTWEGIHYLAKKESFDAPIIGAVLRKVKGISANRDGNDVRAVLDCFKCLKNGEKICIFPEGTRNKTDAEMLPFRHGAAALAIKAKAPIVPIMTYKKPRFFRKTHVLIGDAFELSEYYDKKLTEEDYELIDGKLWDLMVDMRKRHTEYLESKKKRKA